MRHLLVYFGKYGTTKNTARIVQETLGTGCDIIRLGNKKADDIDKYKSIIIGTAIYAGDVPKQVKNFVQVNKNILLSKKLSLFVHCLEDDMAFDHVRKAFGNQVFNHMECKSLLGGRVRLKEHNILIRQILKSKGKKTGLDFTNYDTTNVKKMISFANQVMADAI